MLLKVHSTLQVGPPRFHIVTCQQRDFPEVQYHPVAVWVCQAMWVGVGELRPSPESAVWKAGGPVQVTQEQAPLDYRALPLPQQPPVSAMHFKLYRQSNN